MRLRLITINFLCFSLLVTLSSPASSWAAATAPENWKVEGALAALEDDLQGVQALAMNKLLELEALDRIGEKLPLLFRLSRETDFAISRKALEVLRHLSGGGVLHLVSLLEPAQDEDPSEHESHRREALQTSAALVLGEMGAQARPAIPALLLLLHSESSPVRLSAAEALSRLVRPEDGFLAGPIIALLLDTSSPDTSSPELQVSLLKSLHHLLDADTVAYIWPYLDPDQPVSVREAALEALAVVTRKDKEVLGRTKRLSEDPEPALRIASVKILAATGVDSVPDLLKRLESEKNTAVRTAILEAIGGLGPAARNRAVPHLEKLLETSYGEVRAQLFTTLGQLDGGKGVLLAQLQLGVKDGDWQVRRDAAAALGQVLIKMKDPKRSDAYLELLSNLVDDSHFEVKTVAVSALSELYTERPPQDYREAVVRLLHDRQDSVRTVAGRALCRMGHTATPYILKVLRDEDTTAPVRAAALSGVCAMSDMDALLPVVKAEDWQSRKALTEALFELGPGGVPLLAILLMDEVPEVRQAAGLKLCQMGEPAVPQLLAWLRSHYGPFTYDAGPSPPLPKHYLALPETLQLLDLVLEDPSRRVSERFLMYFLSGGNPKVKTLLKWADQPPSRHPKNLPAISASEARADLKLISSLWAAGKPYPALRRLFAETLIVRIHQTPPKSWTRQDIAQLKSVTAKLQEMPPSALYTGDIAAISKLVAELNKKDWGRQQEDKADTNYLLWLAGGVLLLVLHFVLVVLLLILYQFAPRAFGFLFWTPVRGIIGLGYFSRLLRDDPVFHSMLMQPFRHEFLRDAEFQTLGPWEKSEAEKLPLFDVREQRTLDGRSALDTSGNLILAGEAQENHLFVRYAVQREAAKKAGVYLKMEADTTSLITDIQAKTQGIAKDRAFLQALVYNGALNLFIEDFPGLSYDKETLPTTGRNLSKTVREELAHFLCPSFGASVLLTTQNRNTAWTNFASALVCEIKK